MKLKLTIAVLLFLLFTIGSSTNATAQEYFKSIGLRGGPYSGLSYKAYVTDINSYELLGLAKKNGKVTVAAIYQ